MDSDRLLSSLLASGQTTDIIEPFTGATLYSLPTSTEDDVDAVFDEARRAQRMWADTPFRCAARSCCDFTMRC